MDFRNYEGVLGMRVLGLFVFLFALNGPASAAIFDYDIYLPQTIKAYIRDMQSGSRAEGSPQCEPMYRPMLKDGILDIRYAFGYFDDSQGKQLRWNGINYGISPSMDIVAFESLRQVLASRCTYRNMRLCEFQASGDQRMGKMIFEKEMEIQGEEVLVRITMTQGSVSESYSQNIGQQANKQRFFIDQSEENYFGGLEEADVVFYNGHSRDGGGPDFRPPILNKYNKTDYKNYYQVEKPGIRKTLEAISRNPNPGFVVGLFSCYSRSHFYKDFMRQNPEQRLILSADTIDYFDSMIASIGYMEAILRGQCGQDMANTAKKGSKIKRGYQQYLMN